MICDDMRSLEKLVLVFPTMKYIDRRRGQGSPGSPLVFKRRGLRGVDCHALCLPCGMERERGEQSAALEPLGAVRNGRGLSPAAWIGDAAGSCCGLPGIAPEPGRWIVSILGTWSARDAPARCVRALCARFAGAAWAHRARSTAIFVLGFCGIFTAPEFLPRVCGKLPAQLRAPYISGADPGGACRAVYCAHFGHMNRLIGSHFVRFSLCAHLHAHKAFIFYICSILPRPRGGL